MWKQDPPKPDNEDGSGGIGCRCSPAWKGLAIRRSSCMIGIVVASCILMFLGATWLQSSGLRPGGLIGGDSRGRRLLAADGRFVPDDLLRVFEGQEGRGRIRLDPKSGVRHRRLALVLASLKKDASSLMLLTIGKSLKELGYDPTVFAVNDGEARSLWEQIGCQISILRPESAGFVDWSIFEGVILSSLEAREIISSLMQEPFYSIPVIWIIQEDILGNRISLYKAMGFQQLIAEWRSAFSRADVVVFPDFTLRMKYNELDTGNFFVIPGSPVHVLTAEKYIKPPSKYELRKINGFHGDDVVILVTGSYFYNEEFLCGFPAAMDVIGSQLKTLASSKDLGGSFKFVFLCGESLSRHDAAFQDFRSRLGFPDGSLSFYTFNGDVNHMLLMADIVMYGSFQEEQSFPPLLMRAMSFKIPILAPDLAIIKKYVVDKVHGMLYEARNPDTLIGALSLLISDMKLSQLAHVVAEHGRSHSKNMLALECIGGYVQLLERFIKFPSDVIRPGFICQIKQRTWAWDLFEMETKQSGREIQQDSIVFRMEEDFVEKITTKNATELGGQAY